MSVWRIEPALRAVAICVGLFKLAGASEIRSQGRCSQTWVKTDLQSDTPIFNTQVHPQREYDVVGSADQREREI